jgi:hypothetical protein
MTILGRNVDSLVGLPRLLRRAWEVFERVSDLPGADFDAARYFDLKGCAGDGHGSGN